MLEIRKEFELYKLEDLTVAGIKMYYKVKYVAHFLILYFFEGNSISR